MINGVRITNQYDDCVRFHVNGYHLKQHIMTSSGWTAAVWNEVDFNAFGSHFRRLRPHQQANHMKIVHNQLPLGDRRYRQASIKEESLRLCPCCKSQHEHLDHFLQCAHNQSQHAALSKLKSDICTTDIHPVRYLLSSGLVHWLTASQTPFAPSITEFPEHFHALLHSALASQARIGWNQAVKGYISKQWSILATMDMHHPTATDTNKGSSRIRSILRGLFDFTRQL